MYTIVSASLENPDEYRHMGNPLFVSIQRVLFMPMEKWSCTLYNVILCTGLYVYTHI